MNNDREELEARIAAYIDGELAPADAARLEVFLANTDPKLAEQVIGMIGDKHRLRSLPAARAPEDLAPRILEQVERATLLNNVDQFSTHHRPWWQSRAAVAAALFLVFGGFAYFILQALRTTNPIWQAVVEPPSPPPSHVAAIAESAPEAAAKAAPAMPSEALAMRAQSPAPAEANHDGILGASATPATLPSMAAGAFAQADTAHEQPVVLALVAQEPDDFDRLRQMIDGFRGADFSNASSAQVPAGAARRGAPEDSSNAPTTQTGANIAPALAPGASMPQQRAAAAKAGAPVTYHVTLRPGQIEQLAHQFQVQTLTPLPPTAAASVDQNNEEKSPEADAPVMCIITMASLPVSPTATAPFSPATAPATQP